jgi:hypothetical protein
MPVGTGGCRKAALVRARVADIVRPYRSMYLAVMTSTALADYALSPLGRIAASL